ncbi:proton-coupled amino acid transporter-like protein pathetic [Leptinotarsa decemlineata]|uniref:proton-coupled amino acid transporter-like protein pathetic n=1 Tax=Leptinotarsa decemlineata TaxID=7539 RepID=UPI003D30C8F9
MATKTVNGSAELEGFLSHEKPSKNGAIIKYKFTKELERGNLELDPLKSRKLEHPVSDSETLTHLLKASFGTGILSMPAAFYAAGLSLGIFLTILISIICTHCAYILVVCAHELCRKSQKSQMSFADVAEEACLRGPKWGKKISYCARKMVLIGTFVTYFMSCSCYAVIVAKNFNQVANHYLGYEVEIRITIALLMIPLILLACVPNLKYLAPVSMVANVAMAFGLGITMYYLVADIPAISERRQVAELATLPIFLSITIFAIEAIGVVMPLENNMENPHHFIGLCGVLNQGMSGVTLVYILVGFFGYLKYGDDIKGCVTLNLPIEDYAAQAVNIFIGGAVFCSFGLTFYVCIDIVGTAIRKRCVENRITSEYIRRILMVIICVSIAIAMPTIIPFVSLIGAFCFSFLGLLVPVGIETLTFWDKGFGRCHWKIFKNIIITLMAILALIFGSKTAVEEIIVMYTTNMADLNSNSTVPSGTVFNSTIMSIFHSF